MSDTQNYLRDMTWQLGVDHEPIASRPYTEMWPNYMNSQKSVCVFAPRQSGKTYALMQKFINTPNSVYITANTPMVRDVQRYVQSQGFIRGDLRIDSDIFTNQTAYRVQGMSLDTVFVDEVDSFRTSVVEFMETIMPHTDKIIMVTTPSGRNDISLYDRYINTVRLPQDFIANHVEIEQVTIEQYFEEGLFEI